MGRELRRKQAKKEGKSLEVINKENEDTIKKYIINIISIVLIITVIYLICGLFITKEIDWFSKKEDTKESENKVTNTILASEIFKQSEEKYYVYFYNFDEKETDGKITNIVNNINDEKVYKVNTNSALNANYVSDESNRSATSLEDLKVTTPTLIKIVNDSIEAYYEGNEIIDNFSK